MQIGGHARADREQCSALDVILDKLDDDFTELLDKVEGGGLDQLDAAETVAVWQRFEAFRNRLPLLDHSLIAAAEAFDLPGTYCCSNLSRFLGANLSAVAWRGRRPGPSCSSGGSAYLNGWGTLSAAAAAAGGVAT
jgi:hypothetical protein